MNALTSLKTLPSLHRTYLLSVSSVDLVVVPLLHSLHCATLLSSHHVYMALIIILILTEDTAFNAALHDIVSGAVIDDGGAM